MLVYSQGAGVGEYTQGSEEVIVREDEGAKGAPRECEEGSALQTAGALPQASAGFHRHSDTWRGMTSATMGLCVAPEHRSVDAAPKCGIRWSGTSLQLQHQNQPHCPPYNSIHNKSYITNKHT